MRETIKLRIGEIQYQEVAYGMDIDRDDGCIEWGVLEGMTLTVFKDQAAAALYRLTSSRDIAQDNLGFGVDAEYRPMLKAMTSLTERLVKALGGRESLTEEEARWL